MLIVSLITDCDYNRPEALLGRAAAALLTGKADAHRADVYTWLLMQPGTEKLACANAKPAPEGAKK